MLRYSLTICLLIINYLLISAQGKKVLMDFLKNENLRHAAVGFKAMNLKTGETVATFNENMALTPASNMKLITTASALNIYGKDFRYKTTVMIDAPVSDSVLNGNLYVIGAGDPTLGSEFTGEKDREDFLIGWLASIKKNGINRISGNVTVVDSLFGYDGISNKWLVEDIGTDYAQGVYGICVFDNIFTVTLPNGVTEKHSLADPGMFLADYLMNFLKDNGLEINGNATTYRLETMKSLMSGTVFNLPENLKEIGATYSPALSEIVREINVHSNNSYAEHIYRKLLLDSVNVKELWQANGLDSTALIIYDGCGLSPQNAVSAEYLTALLTYMYRHGGGRDGEFYRSLPVAGEEGTVATFLKNTKLAGKVHLKSGSMSGVQCFSGYVETNGGHYAFSLLINNFAGKRKDLIKAIERFLVALFP
ncbi:MAG: D-alanyl-D-alanine carboxypeptidase [Dysgonamonadaceae bacterium]|jgi:D-alanyl-D-alanine carboxypeptidase/D-alanyl-D-alanine-endopeptidase (penicillin-binding protein 4)|nr:D-alanyl-D-alanine carboxypeptidase [Dysgonamonadaceae bacterium]